MAIFVTKRSGCQASPAPPPLSYVPVCIGIEYLCSVLFIKLSESDKTPTKLNSLILIFVSFQNRAVRLVLLKPVGTIPNLKVKINGIFATAPTAFALNTRKSCPRILCCIISKFNVRTELNILILHAFTVVATWKFTVYRQYWISFFEVERYRFSPVNNNIGKCGKPYVL